MHAHLPCTTTRTTASAPAEEPGDASLALGSRVRDLRKSTGKTTRQFAGLVGCSQSMLCRIENGERHPKTRLAQALDRAFHQLPGYEEGEIVRLAMQTSMPARTAPLRRPWNLPAVGLLVGRNSSLQALEALATPTNTAPIVLTGPAGVGKRALAVALARRILHAHPHGVITINALGRSPDEQPRSPREIIDMALHGLDFDHDPTATDAERANLLHSSLFRRKMLFLITNADNAEQILPILPGSEGCTILVTSRNTLDGLAISHTAPAHVCEIPPLTDVAATDLLRRVVSMDFAQHTSTLSTIAEACEGLPLAVLAANQYRRRHPSLSPRALATQLTAPGMLRRLHLAAGGTATASLLEAYRTSTNVLGPEARGFLQSMSEKNVTHITVQRAANMLRTRLELAEQYLDELTREHLLRPVSDGWILPRLVAEFAALEADTPQPSSQAG